MKIVVFDFDGTIANSFPWFLSRINHVAKVFRFNEVRPEDVPLLREMGVNEILNHLGISSLKLPFIIFYLKWLMMRESHQIELFPEVAGLLSSLHSRGIKIFILSSNSQKNVKLILKDKTALVTKYYCGAGLKKKDSYFKKIKNHFPDAELISVGDEPRDLMAANKAGILHFNVSWGYASKKVFGQTDVIDSFKGLEDRILRQFNMKS
ncbi:MAG TPA: HAD-IA family hydrolase [Bacteriovoracaceae bacterium]|nr:HAD-IA family hydrolase [Bacteriovoracaceae bacterium]